MTAPQMIPSDWVWPAPVIRVEGQAYRPVVSSAWINEFTRAEGGHAGSDITYPVAKDALPQYKPPTDRSSSLRFFYPPNIPVLCPHDGVVTDVVSTSKGIGVSVSHTGTGFRTFCQHLETARVRPKDKLKAGANMGTAGPDPSGNQIRHIHFELSYWTGVKWQKIDPGTHRTGIMSQWRLWTGDEFVSYSNYGKPGDLGHQVLVTGAINFLQTTDRTTSLQNQRGADFKQAQAGYLARCAQMFGVLQTQIHTAIAQSQGKATLITAPMVFDFKTGLWSDGKAV